MMAMVRTMATDFHSNRDGGNEPPSRIASSPALHKPVRMADGASFDSLLDRFADLLAAKLIVLQQRDRKRLYSINDAAQYLSLSNAQVYRLVTHGKIKSVREGRRWLIDRDELDRFIAFRTN